MKPKFFKYIKYVISGCSAAFINIASLYLLTEFGHVYYLLSAMMAFVFGFIVSFILQKFWTFQHYQREGMHRQLMLYVGVALCNLAFNTFLIYILVEFLHAWYVAAAFFSGLCIAFATFFIYQRFIFIDGNGGNGNR